MFKKFLIFLIVVFAFIHNTYAFNLETGEFQTGECDYRMAGMTCGGAWLDQHQTCPEGQRCVWNDSPVDQNNNPITSNPFPYNNLDRYIGKCVAPTADFPCKDTMFEMCNGYHENENACGALGCSMNQKCVWKYARESLDGVAKCYPGATGCKEIATSPDVWYGNCEAATECGGASCNSDSDCKDPNLPHCQLAYGDTVKTCQSDSTCNLPDYVKNKDGALCSNKTGCKSRDQYCIDALGWGKEDCGTVSFDRSFPSACIANKDQECGMSIPNSEDYAYPKNIFCAQNLACVINGTPYSDIFKYPDPSKGTCKNCPTQSQLDSGTFTCGSNSDCCNNNYECITGKCIKKFTAKTCTNGPSTYVQQGQVCSPKALIGTSKDLCDQCPVFDDSGAKWSVTASGDRVCKSWRTGYTSCDSNSGKCGCTSGNTCSGGDCVAASSCVSDGQTCDPTKTCCNTNSRCVRSGVCQSDVCDGVQSGTTSCVGRESCCGSSGCDASTGKCTEAVPQEGENPPIPSEGGNPQYTGPQISSIQDILNIVGKILYPAAIGLGLFFIVKSGYQILISQGDQAALKSAQENLTSAIVGILFLILSSQILKVIIDLILG